MAKKKSIMTNAMRILNAAKIPFELAEYETDGTVGEHFGEQIAQKLGINPEQSFKTLVARGVKNGIMVVCIPVCCEVDLKKLAVASGDKRVELIAVKELLDLTGYIRGSVSPIGMKKKYPTYICESCMKFETVAVSAGICGGTLIMKPEDLLRATDASLADVVV
ncbi:MAG: Cys-tRNA(Pro) deacylase [Ruminococcaceae bacterium]|nr:Cys-tRNA(Pro) deacylase [Oscillospiraceae bacterium]